MTVAKRRLMENFSRAAEGYDARALYQHGQTLRVFDAAAMVISPQARILDIGCGTGQFAALAAEKNMPWQILGVDIAEGMCRVASARCRAIQADAQQLPVASGSVDAVVSSLCLQWVGNLAPVFSEIARVLKPGGRAVIASLGTKTLHELRMAADIAEAPLALLQMQSAGEYRSAIATAGLSISFFEQSQEIEYYPNVQGLLDSMRHIGAGNNFAASGGAIGPQRFKAMLAAYETLRVDAGIPSTWERLFMVLHKK